ncbi:unnamed protein product [Enterobius vermicularis]|uniref:Calponin-homology (CH) domain-containing protein n=1 Tax=Enterobius vermicularis TaxID=51028 RepID=A0A0N4V0F0_ENTVE|nr:unnamed protein product [Enterobius vermicularis]
MLFNQSVSVYTGRKVNDLFVDLSDGVNLIALLEALSAERLLLCSGLHCVFKLIVVIIRNVKRSREVGCTRFHRIQNIQYCLDFLKKKNIKTVNIRPEDIVEGNPKLTLGLIWTIILNFQVSVIKQRQLESTTCCQVLLALLHLFSFAAISFSVTIFCCEN